ncbi:MAG: DUF4867 family protein [Clostridia bacterium]|nr:DUF4867 family protein [Clostridia bacterium]
MLEYLNQKNDFKIYSVQDPEFASYGRVIDYLDTKAVTEAASRIEMPKEGTVYKASEQTFEELSIARDIADKCFGQMPTQVGHCYGYSSFLNGTEWHLSSEINIATTPLVLLLGHVWELENGKIDSSCFKAFYLPRGTAIECFATTLHFCPCQVEDSGFSLVVALPLGTNTDLDKKGDDALLFRKNKWIVSHEKNDSLIARGVVPGICGENIRINY